MSYSEEYEEARNIVESRLDTYFNGEGLEQAIKYSLMAGGKRLRPVLALKFCEAAGGSFEEALQYACAIEMLHTYSLIHDDLPCMDNDDLRRGIPTCHVKFGEWTAVLAGDALQAAAFRTAAGAGRSVPEERKGAVLHALEVLSDAVGESGMCGGQYMDMEGGVLTVNHLEKLCAMKTGRLLQASCVLGVCASMGYRHVDRECLSSAEKYAWNLGLAFQIRDDILDEMSTAEELGKTAGSDRANNKTTYMSLLGYDECRRLVELYTEEAKKALSGAEWPGGSEFLIETADSLSERNR